MRCYAVARGKIGSGGWYRDCSWYCEEACSSSFFVIGVVLRQSVGKYVSKQSAKVLKKIFGGNMSVRFL